MIEVGKLMRDVTKGIGVACLFVFAMMESVLAAGSAQADAALWVAFKTRCIDAMEATETPDTSGLAERDAPLMRKHLFDPNTDHYHMAGFDLGNGVELSTLRQWDRPELGIHGCGVVTADAEIGAAGKDAVHAWLAVEMTAGRWRKGRRGLLGSRYRRQWDEGRVLAFSVLSHGPVVMLWLDHVKEVT